MRRRIYYSTEQRAEIWDRWKRGESAHEIGRLFDRPHSSIFKILMKTGGLRPPERRRSKLALTLAEREEISRGLVAGLSIRSIATELKRTASTISREVKRMAADAATVLSELTNRLGHKPYGPSPVSCCLT